MSVIGIGKMLVCSDAFSCDEFCGLHKLLVILTSLPFGRREDTVILKEQRWADLTSKMIMILRYVDTESEEWKKDQY